ncbi:MAG: SGNH/GDSL hydrolase family protein [Candidatus Gallimonas sp.]
MRIVFFGDSITDMGRNREFNKSTEIWSYGSGYPMFVAGSLYGENPQKYEVINRGISGDRVVDLYARMKADVWNLQPDVLSILIGINDVWHEIGGKNGVELDRFEKVYRMMIEDTKKALPDLKIVLCEPFVLEGSATVEEGTDKYQRFCEVFKYAAVVKKIAKEYGLYFLPLQEKLNEKAAQYGGEHYLYDGVHPIVAGAKLIADEWVKLYQEKIEVN